MLVSAGFSTFVSWFKIAEFDRRELLNFVSLLYIVHSVYISLMHRTYLSSN